MVTVFRYGLIGKSLKHSASPALFDGVLRPDSPPIPYACFEVAAIADLPDVLNLNPELLGLNVTLPYKTQVLRFADKIDGTVATVGAANTLYLDRQLGICAFNTDPVGVKADLVTLLKGHHPKTVLILGTGGAAKAVAHTLTHCFNVRRLEFASRKPTERNHLTYAAANKKLADYELLINTTPVGMYPDTSMAPALKYDELHAGQYVWDLIYNPLQTVFLKRCERQGAKTLNGWGMLVAQAQASLEIWENPLKVHALQSNPWQQETVQLKR